MILFPQKHCDQSIARRYGGVIIPLYSALFRLHLDYCVLFGASQHKTDVNKLQQIQQRAFMMVRDRTTFPVKRGKVGWACPVWRRDILEGEERGRIYSQKFTKRTIRLSREVMQSLSILEGFLDQTGYRPGPPGMTSELKVRGGTRDLLTSFPTWMSLCICSFHVVLLSGNSWLSLNSSQVPVKSTLFSNM